MSTPNDAPIITRDAVVRYIPAPNSRVVKIDVPRWESPPDKTSRYRAIGSSLGFGVWRVSSDRKEFSPCPGPSPGLK
jgi:hypothetical protein